MTGKILVTAGPTREKIDPVRYISNYSTGTFGYEIAKAAVNRGFRVVLISGPVSLDRPKGVKLIRVESALELRAAVLREAASADYIVMAAAVSDWRVKEAKTRKIKRTRKTMRMELVENPDILSELGKVKGGRVLAGFALESEGLEKNALKKLKAKNLDIIIANKIDSKTKPFGKARTSVSVYDRYGGKLEAKNRTKAEIAEIILDKVLEFI